MQRTYFFALIVAFFGVTTTTSASAIPFTKRGTEAGALQSYGHPTWWNYDWSDWDWKRDDAKEGLQSYGHPDDWHRHHHWWYRDDAAEGLEAYGKHHHHDSRDVEIEDHLKHHHKHHHTRDVNLAFAPPAADDVDDGQNDSADDGSADSNDGGDTQDQDDSVF